MSWDYEAVNDIIDKTTTVYRKGEAITERDVGHVHVTEIMGYPSVSEAHAETIDVHFFSVFVDVDKARELSGGLAELLAAYPNPDRLKGGPSYIELGGELWDQEHALRLFALGEALRMWEVVTPERIGITGPKADELAGNGFVMCTGWSVESPKAGAVS